ncbi:MAG: Uma2 family endonuclease [Acidobacteria bacterium]|jgi:Uma2 family endonuclease|nr:Uma2 family endonuclease [Acidobacteriota bacterium]
MSETKTPQTEKNYTAEEYLKNERAAAVRHEFVGGKVLSVADSNRTRCLLATNAIISIGSRIHGQKNEIYAGSMRVQINANRFSYPDVVIVNTKPIFADSSADILQNPTIVLEIYSKNTNSVDKTEKLESYLAMDSIREYVLIKEDEMRVEHYAKQNAKQWVYRIYNERDEVVALDSINCKVSVTEIYSQINFEVAGKPASA